MYLQSGAKINISDASCPERIVTVTGTNEQLNKAFDLITTKFDEIRVSSPLLPAKIIMIDRISMYYSRTSTMGQVVRWGRSGAHQEQL